MIDEEWFYDEPLKLSDEEFTEFIYLEEETTQQWQRCSLGVLSSLRDTVLKLLLCSILKRFLVFLHTKGKVSESMLHLSFTASGLFVLGTQNNFLLSICVYIALIAVLPYYKFRFNNQTKLMVLLYSTGMILIWQYFLTAEEFMSVRGILMIILMKIISLSFDLINELYEVTLLHLLSYVFDGSTVLFGPWITYNQYQDSLHLKELKVEIANCFRALSYVVLSLLAVIYSSCITDSFTEWPYIGAYFVAQSFRFSHYFVSWFSAGTSLLSGVDSGIVADFIHIELPRSLVDVVVSWNIPMHRFLRQYIFGEIKKYGSAPAIFFTYIMSSLFHGINFQVSAVLLSLGLYTYAETRLRSKLSYVTDSCVRARKCGRECHHTWNENALSTLAVNMVFQILAVVHLVYLGMAFDDTTAEIGYSWRHTLSVWADSYYFSHVIGFLTLLLSFAL